MTNISNRIDELIEEYRARLHGCVDGLSEDEARLRLVPSKTTLLGLLKHATYLEGFYFEHAITGRSTKDIGIASTPDRSFNLTKSDSIATVQYAYRRQCEQSRARMGQLGFDQVVHGRGSRPVWAIEMQVLRELAHHAGHADILREQVLARRNH